MAIMWHTVENVMQCMWVCALETMMKPYFKGKKASTKLMYSRNLIHPRVYENTPSCIVKYSACGERNTPQCLDCGIIVQASCTVVFQGRGGQLRLQLTFG